MFISKIVLVAILAVCFTATTNGAPSIEYGKRFEFDYTSICLDNCAQCKQMFHRYFDGYKCATSCVANKGKTIPDCEDIKTIEKFITNFAR